MRLLKKVRLYDNHSPYHQKEVNILIKDGIILDIGPSVQAPDALIFEEEGACVSMGWMDVGGFAGEPGYEHREDLTSFSNAAAAGGFTDVICLPNTKPVLDNKSGIAFVRNQTTEMPVNILPAGALSVGCAGKDLAELMEMNAAGACLFTDGIHPVQDTGLMLRALQYVKSFDGLVMNMPLEEAISNRGLMHEGEMSTSLGLQGIPELAETLMVERDINLAAYANSRLLVYGISTASSVQKIAEAKKAGLKVFAAVPLMNLCFNDSELAHFDENFKVRPPLRSVSDQKALWEGLKTGIIDIIVSGHLPWNDEAKKCEFPYAAFGASTIETVFSALMTFNAGGLPLPKLIDIFTIAPRKMLGLDTPLISPGCEANLTIFHPSKSREYTKGQSFSQSNNSPFFGKKLQGVVFGTIRGRRTHIFNPTL